MRSRARAASVALVATALLAGILAVAFAKSGPRPLQSERVVLENDKVRVVEYTSRPTGGVCGVDLHSHPAHVTIVLSPGRDRLTPAGGKPEESELKVGDVFWSDAESHVDVNVGKSNTRLMVVEIK